MKKRLKYMAVTLLLCFGIGARAGNTVTITGGSGTPNEEVTVRVGMTNTDQVAAMQLSIPLDANVTFVDGSETASTRLSGHSMSAGVKDGVLHILIYSAPMANISGSSGELLSFKLKLGDVPMNIPLAATALKMTNSAGNTLTGTCQQGTVSIRCAKAQYSTMTVDYGSVPIRSSYSRTVTITNVGNEPLNVTSLIFSDPTVFSSTTKLPLEVAAGNSVQLNVTFAPTERGTVSKTMKVICNSPSTVNTIQLKAQPYAVNELYVGNASGVSDEEVTVNLTMKNMDDIIGFQVEFQLPNVLEYVDGSFELNAARKEDHDVTTLLNGNLLRILCYSSSGKPLKGNDGVVGSFRVKLVGRSSVTLKASKAILTAFINGQTTNVTSADYGGRVTISSPRLNASSSLAFGDVPVTGSIEKSFTIWNYGSAPLKVSRITFDNENFSVKESLPLELAASKSTTITVCNADKTEGDFSTTMNIYSNDPELRMLAVSVTGRIFAPNYLTVTANDAMVNGFVPLHIGLNNYDAIEGIQFDITSSEDYTIDEGNIEQSTRGSGLSVTVQKVSETMLRVVAYVTGNGIAPGLGELMELKLMPANALAEGSYQVTISNVKLGTSGLVDKNSGTATQSVNFRVRNVTLGDVNGNNGIDIGDAVSIVNYLVGKPSTTFVEQTADTNKNGKIDIGDAITIVNYLVGKNTNLSRSERRTSVSIEPQ